MKGAVCRAGSDLFRLEDLTIEDPRPDEVLVRFTATGLCHTDLEVAAGFMPTPFPVVAGHEGAGVVELVGAAVTDGSVGLRDASGNPVRDHFFGQSSFADYGLCRPSSLIRIPATAPPDHILAPLGCGVITGAGAVWNALKVTPGSAVAVFGAGAVGLSAIMAATAVGADRIIVSDIHSSRLDLALHLGATDVFDASDGAGAEQVRELTGGMGVDFSVESSGVPDVMTQAVESLSPLGSAVILGIPPNGAELRTNAFALLEGRTVTGCIVGHQSPAVLVQRVLRLHDKGHFPVEAMIRTYALDDIDTAVDDARSGAAVKPVLLH
jgi:aryl-alcohol dehydrogenase